MLGWHLSLPTGMMQSDIQSVMLNESFDKVCKVQPKSQGTHETDIEIKIKI